MKLEKFLCCFELELGGSVIGFYHLIIYCFMVLVSIVSFVAAIFYGELKIDLKFFLASIQKCLIYSRGGEADFPPAGDTNRGRYLLLPHLHLMAAYHGS